MTPADDPTPTETPAPAHHTTDEAAHPDPITGEPGAHPVGVGVGAVGAGIAGAAIGMIAGPVGALIGAAIGAVAGGLAGKEVASADDEPLPADSEPNVTAAGMSGFQSTGLPAANLMAPAEAGLPETEANLTTAEDSVAGSNVDEPVGITAGQFHDAFTATTLHETEAEDQLVDDETGAVDPDDVPLPEGIASTGTLGGTPFGRASEREERVRHAAFYRFLDRQSNGVTGDELGDWTSAEKDFPVV